MKISDELKQQLTQMRAEAKTLIENKESKLEDITAKQTEIDTIIAKIKVQEDIEAQEESVIKNKIDEGKVNNKMNNEVNGLKVFAKALRRESLTEVENALVTGGSNNENLIIPVDVNTRINELRKQYKAAKDLIGYYPTTTLTGSFVYEDSSTVNELTNFTDGVDVPSSNEPKFTPTSYAVKEYGGILPISNVLLQNENGGLVSYIGNWFNKKAILTENKQVFAKLQEGKTATALADWKALKKSLNVDLDPSFLTDAVIVTNQDGFDVLDSALDSTGRPVLQPNPTDPTKKMFMGYPIEVFSNTLLPTTGTTTKKSPIFYGSLKAGATFVSREALEFKSSTEAGFTKNQTLVRVIELFDVIKADNSAYIYGQLTIA